MSLEMLQVIASLCLMSSGDRFTTTYDKQLECQQEYIQCVIKKDDRKKMSFWYLKECILEK